MRTAGETSSSYCPVFTDHKKPRRKDPAIKRLNAINIKMTLMLGKTTFEGDKSL